MTPDTAALRAQIRANEDAAAFYGGTPNRIILDPATVRALCDAADEVERLREDVEALHGLLSAGAIGTAPGSDSHRMVLAMRDHYKRQRDASRTAHAALVAELRALCDDSDHGWVHRRDLRALLDRHAPTTGATP